MAHLGLHGHHGGKWVVVAEAESYVDGEKGRDEEKERREEE